ncbi:MAG: glutaminyl-peptide cyclotransferase [Candidatus Acidiferrum sp.]|jgi:glutamine cyclotransferase
MSSKPRTIRGFASTKPGALALSLTICLWVFSGGGVGGSTDVFQASEQSIPLLHVKILKRYPHDPHAFTQGLEYVDGFLYESTGERGQSSVRKVEIETGKVLQKTELSSEYFAEGLTIFEGKIFQLTWLSNVGFVYDVRSFRKLREFHYYGEGWGLAHDGSHLILSDGTNRLRYLDPKTLEVVRTLEVYAGKEAVTNLNELEFIENEIYANVWHSNRIARIDPASGQVRAWIDCSAIAAQEQKEPEGVLNGIANDPARHRLFITGKDWAHLFEIQVEDSAR